MVAMPLFDVISFNLNGIFISTKTLSYKLAHKGSKADGYP
jgi:hypothetical protein